MTLGSTSPYFSLSRIGVQCATYYTYGYLYFSFLLFFFYDTLFQFWYLAVQ